MSVFSPDWPSIHEKKTLDIRVLPLAVLSVVYGMACKARLWLYRTGIFKARSLPGLVVSLGNLTVGGTGKTPAVVMIARWARDLGYRVAVLSRGYGGKYEGQVLEVSDGKHIHADPGQCGDEPILLANKLSGIPVIISKKRFHAGLYAHEKFGCDFFLLDDGFQHLDLKRDLDLVLIDALKPYGNGHLLPWGPLREPFVQLGRADVFILTRVSHHGVEEHVRAFLKRDFPSTPVFYSDHVSTEIVFPDANAVCGPDLMEGIPVVAFAGIARPELFRETLIKLGADVVYFRGYRDHYPFGKKDIENLMQMKEEMGARYVLTTEKDWVRIACLEHRFPELAYLSIDFNLLSDHDEFFRIIEDQRQQF